MSQKSASRKRLETSSASSHTIECDAIFKFVKNLWHEDPLNSLKYILKIPRTTKVFMEFLKKEYCDIELEFYLEAQKLESVSSIEEEEYHVNRIYHMYMVNDKNVNLNNLTSHKIRDEALHALKILANNAFPRFMKSKYCDKTLESIRSHSVPDGDNDFMSVFTSMAETMPCCITIADMTIPGAPLIFVNPKFCDVTGYSKNEIYGHNCRFLQGPRTEPEAIQVLHDSLSRGQDCHVKLTNYRKNGETFQNSLSLRAVYDSYNVYHYVIGIQHEIKDYGHSDLKNRLMHQDKLLCLIPSRLYSRRSSDNSSSQSPTNNKFKYTSEIHKF